MTNKVKKIKFIGWKKVLYRFKQVPRTWYTCINTYFLYHGFQKCLYEHTLYIKINKDGDIAVVYFYVDDLIFTDNNSRLLSEFMEYMIAHFEMTYMGLMLYFFSIKINQTDKGIFISQKKYIGDILKKFKMEACKPILTPAEERLKLAKDGSGDLVDATNFRRLWKLEVLNSN